MTDTRSPVWPPCFPSAPWKNHIRQYIDLLSTSCTWGPLYQTPPWLVDVLHLSAINRFPMETAPLLEFCQQHPSAEFRATILEWMLNRSVPSPSGNDEHSLSAPEHYALLLSWVAGEKDNDVLTRLARIPPPSGMTADERKKALAVWETRLELKNEPVFTTTKTAIYCQMYLLADDHEEQYRILQKTLPSRLFQWVWPHLADRHLSEYPGDVPLLRQYFLNLLEQEPDPEPYGWTGIALLGAGEDEARLLDMARKYYSRQPPPDDEREWIAFSKWKPDAPAVRAELLDWWYNLKVDVLHPALQARWNALFALEEDESRLVNCLAGATPDTLPLAVPDDWCPRCPLARARLAGVVTQLLERPDARRETPSGLWNLLFRLSVPGPRMAELIHTTLNTVLGEEDDAGSPLTASLSHIRYALQESPLPIDTPPETIRQTVTLALSEMQSRSAQPYISWHVDNLPRFILEMLRAGISRGDTSLSNVEAPTASVPRPVPSETDMAWVTSTLEVMAGPLSAGMPVRFTDMTDYVTCAWRDGTLPGALPIIYSLWTLGIKNLENHFLQTGVENHAPPYVKSMLSALARLTRQIYPLSPTGDASAFLQAGSQTGNSQAGASAIRNVDAGSTVGPQASVSPPIPSGLWKVLSDLVRHTTDREIFLLASSIGNALVPYADTEQQSRWWAALSGSSPALASAAPDLPDRLRQDFLLHYLAATFAPLHGEEEGFHLPDTTAVLRQLRFWMHLFPDPPPPASGFWADLWQETFDAWKTGWAQNVSGKAPDSSGAAKFPECIRRPEFMDEPFAPGFSSPPAAPAHPRTAERQGIPAGDNRLHA